MRWTRGFDGLRGIAAVLVVLTHLGALTPLVGTPLEPMFYGGTAVQFFFVLSGLLITQVLMTEHDGSGKVNLRDFYIRRALRILPLYLLFMTFVTLVCVFVYPVSHWLSLLAGWCYLYNFLPLHWYSVQQTHTWALAVEQHFYLIWPLVFCAFYRTKRRALPWLCGGLIAASYLCYQVLGSVPLISMHFNLPGWTFIAGGDIMIGCLLALLLGSRDRKAIPAALAHPLSLCLGVVLWSNSLLFLPIDGISAHYLRDVGFGLILSWIFCNQDSWLPRALDIAPLKYLGKLSYGIYIYQGLFLATGSYRAVGQTWPPAPAAGVLLLCLVAPLSYHSFESAFLRMAKAYKQKGSGHGLGGVPDAAAAGSSL